jgi:hypothetical protein
VLEHQGRIPRKEGMMSRKEGKISRKDIKEGYQGRIPRKDIKEGKKAGRKEGENVWFIASKFSYDPVSACRIATQWGAV